MEITDCNLKKLPRDFTMDKYGLHVRFVEEGDAAFICEIRSNPKAVKFLHSGADDIERQVQWIREYKKRESEGKDFYFVFETPQGEKLGVVRMYSINENSFTTGSWAFKLNAPKGASILADIICKEFGFELYPDSVCLWDANEDNTTVLNYGKSYNPQLLRREGKQMFFSCTKEDCERTVVRYKRMLLR